MKVLLIGGGSGGHITPLLAVARELKQLDATIELIGVCEKNAKFVDLFKHDPTISAVYQVRAGKYRRYSGLTKLQKLTDVSTFARNVRDVARVCVGYTEARRLLKRLKPDGILIKGGFVAVPVGLAAAHLGIPFITHDSDSTPGLANRIISKWARKHATGMPASFYNYPAEKTVYTGVPVGKGFARVTYDRRQVYKANLGLQDCTKVVTIIGGSQGGTQLNEDVVGIAGQLMQHHKGIGIIHIAGPMHEKSIKKAYKAELLADECNRVVVRGFVDDVFNYTGAADVVVSRASATVVAELMVQGVATILVPGKLADNHQVRNASLLAKNGVALHVDYGDKEGLYSAIDRLFMHVEERDMLVETMVSYAKPHAARDLAQLVMYEFKDTSGKHA